MINLQIFPVATKYNEEKEKWAKTPLTGGENWQTHKATKSAISKAKNIGIVIPAGVLVIDIDTYKGVTTNDIDNALGCKLDWSGAELQKTVSGGYHYGFLIGDAVLKQGSDVLGVSGFDTRTSGKGWICSGEGYECLSMDDVDEVLSNAGDWLPELPGDVIELLSENKTRALIDDFDDIDLMLAAQPLDDLSLEKMGEYLSALDSDYYENETSWYKVGMAIFHQTKGSEDGYKLFDTFSKPGKHYDESANRKRWDSFSSAERGNPITFASVIKWSGVNTKAQKIKSILKDDKHKQRAIKALNDTSKFIMDKVGFKIEVEVDVVHAMLVSCFWNPQQNKLNTINDMDEKVIFNEKDVSQMLVTFFGNPITNYEDLNNFIKDDEEMTQTQKNSVLSCAMTNIIRTIKAYYQRSAIEQRVDMFSDRTYFDFAPDKAIEHHKHIELTPPKGVLVDELAVSDYLKHFPQCIDVLEMIIAARFASSRKKAYLWLKAPSDWGKDFFRVALGTIATEMSVKEVEKAIEGAPVGKSPTDLLRSMVLVTNEFKKVKSELKQLEDGIKLSPKYQLETYVPLYTKLFMSAEGVDSLMGEHGVEAQFANRFSMLDVTGCINNIKSFKRMGGHKFMQAIQTYFCEVLNKQIESYRELGNDEASKKGDAVVIAFHKKYSISNGRKTLENNLDEIAELMKEEIIKLYQGDNPTDGEFMYLKSAKTRIKNVLFNSDVFDKSEAYTISYKIDDLMVILCPDKEGVKAYCVEGKTIKALKISLSDDFNDLDVVPF